MRDDKSSVLSDVCVALMDNQLAFATDILRDRYPFVRRVEEAVDETEGIVYIQIKLNQNPT